jgi:hypothetical protein
MTAMNEWWGDLDSGLQMFCGIALVSTAILLIQTILLLFGVGDHDMPDHDMDLSGGHTGSLDGHAHDGDNGGLGLLSVRTIIAFLVGFGWSGAVARAAGAGMPLAIPVAAVVGFLLMLSVFWIMKLFWSFRQSGNLDYTNAIGEIATVYLPIPPDKAGAGQIEVLVQGRLQVVKAFTSAAERLENRRRVLVIDTVGTDGVLVAPHD